jgi:hypothetical protein
MKKRLRLSLLIVLVAFGASGQNFPLKSVWNNGPPARNVNLVFLPDGYTATDMEKFVGDVNTIVEAMFKQSPFKEYKAYFNVYAILVPSGQSGAAHPQTTNESDCLNVPRRVNVNNYFGSTFDNGNVHRLLAPTHDSKVASVLADNFPLYDMAFVLVNTNYSGGSGGDVATSSNTKGIFTDVATHEIGHVFGGLADEYWSGSPFEAPNLTIQGNPSLVKWRNWIGTAGVEVHAIGEGPGWYRPHSNCKMRYNASNFCPVCRETIIELIHSYADALVSYSPKEREMFVQEGVIDFAVEVKKTEPNTLQITWLRNGEKLSEGKNETDLTLSVTSLKSGRNTIEVQIVDTTALTRSDLHLAAHIYKVVWAIDTDNVTGVEINPVRSEYEIKIYPNPVEDQLTVSYTLPENANVNIELVGGDGKNVKTFTDEKQAPGTHTYAIPSSQLNMNTPGLYYLVLRVDGSKLVEKLIRK